MKKTCNPLILLARPEGFEPPTCGFEVLFEIRPLIISCSLLVDIV